MQTFPSVIKEVEEWSLRNFGDKQNPLLGMIEEVGELAHCLLKRQQGIRGYENPEFFMVHYLDAIGDVGVYSANFAYQHHITIDWPVVDSTNYEYHKLGTHNKHISSALFWLAHLGLETMKNETHGKSLELNLKSFLVQIELLANLENLTFADATCSVWAKVKHRDWTKNKTNGVDA